MLSTSSRLSLAVALLACALGAGAALAQPATPTPTPTPAPAPAASAPAPDARPIWDALARAGVSPSEVGFLAQPLDAGAPPLIG